MCDLPVDLHIVVTKVGILVGASMRAVCDSSTWVQVRARIFKRKPAAVVAAEERYFRIYPHKMHRRVMFACVIVQ